jgi:hypothetical protein
MRSTKVSKEHCWHWLNIHPFSPSPVQNNTCLKPPCVTRIWNYTMDYACNGLTSSKFLNPALFVPPGRIWYHPALCCEILDCFQSSTVLTVRYEQRGIQPVPVPSYCSKTRGHKIWVRLNSSKIALKAATQPSSLMIWDRLFRGRETF